MLRRTLSSCKATHRSVFLHDHKDFMNMVDKSFPRKQNLSEWQNNEKWSKGKVVQPKIGPNEKWFKLKVVKISSGEMDISRKTTTVRYVEIARCSK